MGFYTDWRALIGPLYTHYDWSALNYAATTTLDYNTTVTGNLSSGTTSVIVGSNAAFAASGWLWIGPGPATSGQGWEYCPYTGKSFTTSFTGLTREAAGAREHNGFHNIGARVYAWYPVQGDDGELHLTEAADGTLSVLTWQAGVKGVNVPQWVMRNGHICVIQTRTSPSASWALQLLGVLSVPTYKDDGTANREWSVRVMSMDHTIARQPAKSIHVGQLDVGKNATAAGSTALVLPSDERDSGDYTGGAPDFSATSVTDRDADTLWIAERFMGSAQALTAANGDGMNSGGLKFSQVYVNPPAGAKPGGRWIELILMSGSFQGFAIYRANGGSSVEWILGNQSGLAAFSLIILCEDEDVFREMNPLASPEHLIERRSFFSGIRPEGGELRLRIPATNQWSSRMRWGDGHGGVVHNDLTPSAWPGPTITAPTAGQNMRYIHVPSSPPNAAAYWQTGKIKTPGYKVDTTPDQWVHVTLPPTGLVLADDITASVPGNGALLKISDAAGNASTSGLPNAGAIQIGDEQMNYASKSESGVTLSTARGANGTTPAAHKKGDTVYLLDSNGVATDALAISQIGWRRAGGTIYPLKVTVRRSSIPGEVRVPDAGDWQNDWIQVFTDDNYGVSTWNFTFSPSVRVKHLLIQIERMTTDPARPRLNEVVAVLDSQYHLSETWLANDTTAGNVIRQILLNAGIPSGAITVNAGTPALRNISTADDMAWAVATDLAEYAGCRISVQRDGKFVISPDTFWTSTPGSSFTWTDVNAGAVELNYNDGLGVAQVKQPWRAPDESAKGEEVYPATADDVGEVLELAEQIYADGTAAQASARKRYFLSRYPVTALVEAADGQPGQRPFEVHRLQWLFSDEMAQVNRLNLVVSTDHYIRNSNWETVHNLQQVEREVGF